MQVVLKVWSSNPDHSGACEFALVEITPDFAKLALHRIAVLREQKTLDPAVEETSCWESGDLSALGYMVALTAQRAARRA